MAEYNTHQKKLLLDFLAENREQQYTIGDLCSALERKYGKDAPGTSTIYRIIKQLVEENTVKRFVKLNSRHFFYQLAAGKDCHSHLHMKCTGCGKLIHMDHEQTETITETIFGDSSFTVDREHTTIFGICAECSKGIN